MTICDKKTRLLASFERAFRIERRLTNIDWSSGSETFEEEYEALLDEFYIHLLNIDHLIGCLSPTEKRLIACFKSLLETGRKIDSLWDRYHRDHLGRAQFSRLLGGVAAVQRRCTLQSRPLKRFFPATT